jgi:hypothetical protein
MNLGFISASNCARSALNPFGRLLNVFAGKSETTSSANLPLVVARITSDALSLFSVGFNVALYFFQSFDAAENLVSASTFPFGVCKLTVREIGSTDSCRTNKDIV